MRVGFDVSQAIFGTGVSDYTIDLFKALEKNFTQDQFLPIGFSLRRQKEIKKLFLNAKTFPIPPTALDFLWNRWHILDIDQFTGPIDVYHSSDWTQGPSAAKIITTIHDLAPILYPGEHDPQIVAVHKRRLNWVAKESDAVICVSHNTARDFSRLYSYPASKIHVIYEGLPSRFLHKPQKNKEGDYVLAIGARQPRKNIYRLMSVFEKYQKRYNLPKLIIIGEGGIGYVSDQKLVDLMAHAKCFVYPSLYEGFGLPILGAFYHQVPVACSDIAPFQEVAGNAAVYFDPLSEKKIAAGIAEAISKKISGVPRLTRFSWDKTAYETMKVYRSL